MANPYASFADEMEKIAISEFYFYNHALGAISKAPGHRTAAQFARAINFAGIKDFKASKKMLEMDYAKWRRHGGFPKKPYKKTKGPYHPRSRDSEAWDKKSPKPPSSWKKKALIAAGALSLPAGAYGVHKNNERMMDEADR